MAMTADRKGLGAQDSAEGDRVARKTLTFRCADRRGTARSGQVQLTNPEQ